MAANEEHDHQLLHSQKLQKAAAVENTTENLENGVFEVYHFVGGQSDVWDRFFKIRNRNTKEHVEFAQCIECKSLLSFKEQSGTTHLSRHNCRKAKTDENRKYRRLPKDKIEATRDLMTKNTMKLCARDFVLCDVICDSTNFLEWAQSLVLLGYKYGNIDLQDVFPNRTRIHREINKFKDEKARNVYENFREALQNEWCSATLELRTYGNDKKVVIMSIQYFKKELKELEKKVFFSIVLDQGDTPDDFRVKFLKQFNIFGGDERDLQKLKIVTSSDELFSKALGLPFNRRNCVGDTITKVLNEGFEGNNDDNNILSQSRNVVNFINSSEKYNIRLNEENGSWKTTVDMIRSVCENYDDVIKILEKENHKNPIEFNKRKAEEMLLFLEPFIEALDDLSSTSYPTANKILLWWKFLCDHTNNGGNRSIELKQIISKIKRSLEANFIPNMFDMINCFLDPRYKSLKMLSEIERKNVIAEVQKILKELEDEVEVGDAMDEVPGTKRNRFASFETTKTSKEKPKKKNRFENYESNNADLEDDEVNIYLKLPPLKLDHEFDLIEKFWKSKKKTLPKLFKLALTRLHVPASSGIAGPKILTSNEIKENDLNDYIFVRDNF